MLSFYFFYLEGWTGLQDVPNIMSNEFAAIIHATAETTVEP